MNILWFCDAHICPDEDLSRFVALGNYILKHKPETIVQGGDFLTLDSFSRWDRDKRLKIEGRRYHKEVAAGNEALSMIIKPISLYNEKQRGHKEKQYLPHWVWIQGNHDQWPDQYVERNPELQGIVDIRKDLQIDKLPGLLTYIPYTSNDWCWGTQGVYFCHIPRNRIGPVSSKYIADRAIDLFNGSIVFGHTHRLLSSTARRMGSDRFYQSLNGGCFFENDPEYSIGNVNDYWRGLINITLLGMGCFDFETVSMDRLKQEYL